MSAVICFQYQVQPPLRPGQALQRGQAIGRRFLGQAVMAVEIAVLEARRDKTRAIKQGMMQQLLTGRVRLVKPEAAA